MMMKREISNNHYINTMYWMWNLGLKGNEIFVYALIYGYSQSGQGKYHGTIGFIADRLSLSRSQVFRILNTLVEKDLIKKTEIYIPGSNQKSIEYTVTMNEYSSSKMTSSVAKCDTPSSIMQQPPIANCDTYIKDLDLKVIEKDLLDKEDILEKLDKSSKLEDEITFSNNHVLTRYLINARYLTSSDEIEFFRYDNFFNKFIGKNGYEFDDYKLYVQYFIYRNKERIKNQDLKDEPIKNKYGYFITAMEKARREFGDKKPRNNPLEFQL
jgi:predicted transcriptional regulator